MMTCGIRALVLSGLLITFGWQSVQAQAAPDNHPPAVSVLWPHVDDTFSAGTFLKIKANATDSDGTITQVQFFAETDLIGVITNLPFNVIWQVGVRGAPYGIWNLKAVAVDNLGLKSESAPVKIYYYTGGPPEPVLEIISPCEGSLFASPATFVFSAEVLASTGDAGPVEFFVGTKAVGSDNHGASLTATTPPSSITVTNLNEGDYELTVRYRGGNGVYCVTCILNTNTVRVAKLGVQSASLTSDGRFQFGVVTSFTNRATIIEASTNLRDWTPISTNQPSSNTFIFRETSPATNSQRFYRVFLPSE